MAGTTQITMERQQPLRWVIPAVGVGAAALGIALLVEYENKRNRRFVVGSREGGGGGVDKATIRQALTNSAGAKTASGPDGRPQEGNESILEQLLPKTFFADPVSDVVPQGPEENAHVIAWETSVYPYRAAPFRTRGSSANMKPFVSLELANTIPRALSLSRALPQYAFAHTQYHFLVSALPAES